jgi:hypothetical protein
MYFMCTFVLICYYDVFPTNFTVIYIYAENKLKEFRVFCPCFAKYFVISPLPCYISYISLSIYQSEQGENFKISTDRIANSAFHDQTSQCVS